MASPVALVLAVSRRESLAFHRDLKNTVHPLRLVSLLDIQEREISIRGRRVFSLPNLDSYDNLRIADRDRWKEIVDMLGETSDAPVASSCRRIAPCSSRFRRAALVLQPRNPPTYFTPRTPAALERRSCRAS